MAATIDQEKLVQVTQEKPVSISTHINRAEINQKKKIYEYKKETDSKPGQGSAPNNGFKSEFTGHSDQLGQNASRPNTKNFPIPTPRKDIASYILSKGVPHDSKATSTQPQAAQNHPQAASSQPQAALFQSQPVPTQSQPYQTQYQTLPNQIQVATIQNQPDFVQYQTPIDQSQAAPIYSQPALMQCPPAPAQSQATHSYSQGVPLPQYNIPFQSQIPQQHGNPNHQYNFQGGSYHGHQGSSNGYQGDNFFQPSNHVPYTGQQISNNFAIQQHQQTYSSGNNTNHQSTHNNHYSGNHNNGNVQAQTPSYAPIYTKIQSDLAECLTKRPQDNLAPFFCQQFGTLRKRGSHSNQNQNVSLPIDFGASVGKTWNVIEVQLRTLQHACLTNGIQDSMNKVMAAVIRNYCPGAQQKSNFGMLGRQELAQELQQTIPFIVEWVLKLPLLLATPIPILKAGQSKKLYLTRKLCCSLLANAFFCTFPENSLHSSNQLPDFNFFRMFNDTNSDRCEVKKEKIKCILHYFKQFSTLDEKVQHQIVSFERRCVSKQADWANSNKGLCQVLAKPQAKIEDADGSLQCDFANKVIGGGVINDGSVMEEIRFCICPELIVSRLFTETMKDNEVVVITGSLIYSNYTGYSTSFKFAGPYRGQNNLNVDNFGRTFTQLVAIDALSFKKNDAYKQYQKKNIDRELHKCYVAFIHGKNVTPIATGNWGCGAFNGNPELKFLIQLMAASHQERQMLQYHTVGDQQQTKAIEVMSKNLYQKQVTVGQLYKIILQFKPSGFGGLFNYVNSILQGGGGGRRSTFFHRAWKTLD